MTVPLFAVRFLCVLNESPTRLRSNCNPSLSRNCLHPTTNNCPWVRTCHCRLGVLECISVAQAGTSEFRECKSATERIQTPEPPQDTKDSRAWTRARCDSEQYERALPVRHVPRLRPSSDCASTTTLRICGRTLSRVPRLRSRRWRGDFALA